jgi:hypothetical protein
LNSTSSRVHHVQAKAGSIHWRDRSVATGEWVDLHRLTQHGYIGYLGGCTLALLLNHPRVQKKEYAITALIRDAAKAKAFESDNLKTIVGTMSDHDLLFRLCKEFDIVFQSVSRKKL